MFAPIDCYLHNNLKIGYIMHFMMVDQLLTYLQKHYRPEDYPVIRAQYADFESTLIPQHYYKIFFLST